MLTTSPPKKLPCVFEAKHLFHMLFGPDTVCNQRKTLLATEHCAVVATYSDNSGAIKRLLACDLAFANSAGAALSAMPPAAANGATKTGKIADNILENLTEVMNVAVNLFTDSFGARLELVSVKRLNDLSPDTLAALASAQRVKMDVGIPRYELGRVDLVAV